MVKIARALLRHCIRRYASVKRITHNPYPFVSSSTMELSVLISAVKPKDRSDQYKILAALLVLNAHLVPAEAKANIRTAQAPSRIAAFLYCASLALRGGLRQRGRETFLCLPSIYPCSALRALGHAGLTCFRAYGASALKFSQFRGSPLSRQGGIR
jgi:hypothetical protein